MTEEWIETRFPAIAERARQARERSAAKAEQEASEPKQMFLPGFDLGALPNHINRSSLFAPVARGRRKFHHQTEMVSRADCRLEYTGEQLDEADAEIVMALIHLASKHTMGTPVPVVRVELLRKLRRSAGKHDYEWLHRRIRALTEATLYIEARRTDGTAKYRLGRASSFHVLAGFDYDDSTETYSFTLDPRWVVMFGNQEFARLDWDKRMQIGRGQDMAKTLQRLVATSSDEVQRYGLEWLKDKMEYSGRIRDFRDAITRAVAELVRLEIIDKGRIDDSARGTPQLVLWISP
jgi:hypothetical protein